MALRSCAAYLLYPWIAILAWLNRRVFHPVAEWWLNHVVATWEETVKSFFRESVSYLVRLINGCSASFLSVFVDGSYYSNMRAGFDRPNAWQRYHTDKAPSTFNAIIEQEFFPQQDGMSSIDSDTESEASGQACMTPPPRSARQRAMSRLSSLWTWRSGAGEGEEVAVAARAIAATTSGMKRSGSDLFQPNSDGDISTTVPVSRAAGRGLMADLSTALELAVTWVFDVYRAALRFLLRMPDKTPGKGARCAQATNSTAPLIWQQHQSSQFMGKQAVMRTPSAIPHTPRSLARSKSASVLETLHSQRPRLADHGCTAADILHAAGYPSETHTIVTDDGYVLQMERIPRPGAKDAVFFMHGILDTALGWVANGVTRSIAFAAYDQGFDVWLGSCRSNPPRRHTDARIQSTAYWSYSINELGEMDIGAQVDHIHVTKCAELGAGKHIRPADFGVLPDDAEQRHPRRSSMEAQAPLSATAPRLGDPEPFLGGVALTRTTSSASLGGGSGGTLGAASARGFGLSPIATKPPPPPAPSRNGLRHRGKSHVEEMPSQKGLPNGRGPHSAGSESSGATEALPYRLRAVGHSLGGAMLLIYAVSRAMADRPHHLSRLILLTPAGFHNKPPAFAKPFLWFTPLWAWLIRRYLRNGTGMYVPTSMLRAVMTKLMADMQEMPALGELMRLVIRTCMSGDISQWDRALQLPHYNPRAMPAVSAHTVLHLMQLIDSGRFQLYDHGSAAANRAVYGAARPPDIAANYHRLRPLPVDLMAGRQDGVISPENVHRHLHALRAAGVQVSLREFASGHLDFTFSPKDDLRVYILSRLLLPCSP